MSLWSCRKCSHLFAAEANHRYHCRGFLISSSLHALPSQLYQPQTILKTACTQSVGHVQMETFNAEVKKSLEVFVRCNSNCSLLTSELACHLQCNTTVRYRGLNDIIVLPWTQPRQAARYISSLYGDSRCHWQRVLKFYVCNVIWPVIKC